MNPSLTAAWMVEVGIITARDLSQERRPPLPSELLASFVVFGALGLLSRPAPAAAGLAGWGIVVATLLAGRVDVLGPVGDFLTGHPAGAHSTYPPGYSVDPSKGPLPGLGGGVPYGAPGFPAYTPSSGN